MTAGVTLIVLPCKVCGSSIAHPPLKYANRPCLAVCVLMLQIAASTTRAFALSVAQGTASSLGQKATLLLVAKHAIVMTHVPHTTYVAHESYLHATSMSRERVECVATYKRARTEVSLASQDCCDDFHDICVIIVNRKMLSLYHEGGKPVDTDESSVSPPAEESVDEPVLDDPSTELPVEPIIHYENTITINGKTVGIVESPSSHMGSGDIVDNEVFEALKGVSDKAERVALEEKISLMIADYYAQHPEKVASKPQINAEVIDSSA
eukprot:scaffold211_cov447-Prasinococcus_capsulatus_cf.AAC.11